MFLNNIPNEIIWLLLLLSNFIFIILSYKFFGKLGLFIFVAISVIITNIQVVVTLNLFGMIVTLGNITYASTFLVTDILSEYHDKKDAKLAVLIGLFSMVTSTFIMFLVTFFTSIIAQTLPYKRKCNG